MKFQTWINISWIITAVYVLAVIALWWQNPELTQMQLFQKMWLENIVFACFMAFWIGCMPNNK